MKKIIIIIPATFVSQACIGQITLVRGFVLYYYIRASCSVYFIIKPVARVYFTIEPVQGI